MKLLWNARLLTIAAVGAVGLSTITIFKRHLEPQLALGESLVGQNSISRSRADKDISALVDLGSRQAGTPKSEKALAYLSSEYQKVGYETEVQTFAYRKFEDRGSSIIINDNKVSGRALNGSPAASSTASIVVVPNLGRKEDFARIDVEGKIAVAKRGEIRFGDKASNAEAACAVGLIIVNNAPNNFVGTLDREIGIPVLSISGDRGESLLQDISDQSQSATLKVDTVRRLVTGRNLIARRANSTQPKVIVGGHYDSVSGSPGANDNASGTAVVLELARRIARTPQADRVWFLAFDGEEDGLYGSKAFVDKATPQFLSQLAGMINFDMVGINDELKSSGTSSLIKLVEKSSLSETKAVGGSDHIPFANAKVPVLFFTRGLDPNYHTPGDVKVNPQLLDETVEVGLKVTRQILE